MRTEPSSHTLPATKAQYASDDPKLAAMEAKIRLEVELEGAIDQFTTEALQGMYDVSCNARQYYTKLVDRLVIRLKREQFKLWQNNCNPHEIRKQLKQSQDVYRWMLSEFKIKDQTYRETKQQETGQNQDLKIRISNASVQAINWIAYVNEYSDGNLLLLDPPDFSSQTQRDVLLPLRQALGSFADRYLVAEDQIEAAMWNWESRTYEVPVDKRKAYLEELHQIEIRLNDNLKMEQDFESGDAHRAEYMAHHQIANINHELQKKYHLDEETIGEFESLTNGD